MQHRHDDVDDTSRLEAWFEPEPAEGSLIYLPNIDLAEGDAGLTGVIVTDQRIVFCNREERGSVSLDDQGETARQEVRLGLWHHALPWSPNAPQEVFRPPDPR